MPPNDLQKRIEDLENIINAMKADGTFPFDISEAINSRVSTVKVVSDPTGKSLTSEQHGAGAAGLKNPEFWLQITLNNGTQYFLPAYQ